VSAIYGVVSRDGTHVGRTCLSVMAGALGDFGRDGFGEWAQGGAGLGQARRFTTPEGRLEAMPVVDRREGFAFTAASATATSSWPRTAALVTGRCARHRLF
jgi:hypothetical protein